MKSIDNGINFTIGDVYYSVYLTDEAMIYPFVGSYVYLGMDIVGEEKERTWYFQDCESYVEFGSFVNGVKGDRQILGLTKDAVQHLVGIEGLSKELRQAEERRLAAR